MKRLWLFFAVCFTVSVAYATDFKSVVTNWESRYGNYFGFQVDYECEVQPRFQDFVEEVLDTSIKGCTKLDVKIQPAYPQMEAEELIRLALRTRNERKIRQVLRDVFVPSAPIITIDSELKSLLNDESECDVFVRSIDNQQILYFESTGFGVYEGDELRQVGILSVYRDFQYNCLSLHLEVVDVEPIAKRQYEDSKEVLKTFVYEEMQRAHRFVGLREVILQLIY